MHEAPPLHSYLNHIHSSKDIKDNSKLFKAVRLISVASEAVTGPFWSLQEMFRAQHHHVIICITKRYQKKKKSSTKGLGIVYFVFIIGGWQFNLLLCTNPGGSVGKELPAIQETSVRSLSQEYTLEKGMATHASVPAWRIPWTEESDGLHSTGSRKSQTE